MDLYIKGSTRFYAICIYASIDLSVSCEQCMDLTDTPRMWPYEPSNSPLPLPPKPLVATQQRLHWVNAEQIDGVAMSADELKSSLL